MPLQEPAAVRDWNSRQDLSQQNNWESNNIHRGDVIPRQRLRRDRAQGDDLFLNLALNESNFTDNKRQSLPASAFIRSSFPAPTDDRPRSSGGRVGTPQNNEAFPTLEPLQQRRPRHNTLQSARGIQDTNRGLQETSYNGIEQAQRTTPTPSQYTPRSTPYLSAQSPASSHDRGSTEWPASPNMFHFGRRREPSTTFSDAVSRQRTNRLSASAFDNRSNSQDQEPAPHAALHTPTGQRRSDPETESVGSATAPSTVWDELDDLKSRIRNLELTGKAPLTSAAAIANQSGQSGERPRTATTAPTTISSSPNHVRKANPVPSDITVGGPAASNVHPLLHSALAKAKSLLSPPLYRSLEATAADALALAAMTGSAGPQGTAFSAASIISSVNVSDRQIRRKADSMCRNLTDLCIALCEGKTDLVSPTTVRPSPATNSRFPGETPPSRYARRPSVETEDHTLRSSPGRGFSRLDSRRSSVLGSAFIATGSPRETLEQYANQEPSPSQPNQTHVDYAARYNRPGTTLRTRTSRFDDQYDDPTIRAPSRAMTEFGQLRPRRSETTGMQPRSPGLRETLAARRNSGIPEERTDDYTESPISETGSGNTRTYGAASEAGPFIPNKRRRRITSLEQFAASSPRMSGYGGEPRRTTSLSKRRNFIVE